jgi:hypothetical protein
MPLASGPHRTPAIAAVEVDGLTDPMIVYRDGQ